MDVGIPRTLSDVDMMAVIYRRSNAAHATPSDQLYYETFGSGNDTIVFIAGLGGTTRYWSTRLTLDTQRYRIVLVDLLGFGNSVKPWTRYSVDRHVMALRSVLKDFGTMTLVGHSLGALIAVAYAARYSVDVKHLALLGMPYFGNQERAYSYMRKGPVRGGYLYTNIVLTMAVCFFTRRVLGRLLPYILRDIPREVAEDLVKHTWRSSTSSLWEVVYRHDARNDLDRLPDQINVAFIHGEQDIVAPGSAIKQLVSRHANWQLHVLPDVDHHPFLRDPKRCLELIEALVSAPAIDETAMQDRTSDDLKTRPGH